MGRRAAVMHLICYCSISCNKCGRLSDSVASRHVSAGASFCQLACPRLSSPPAEEYLAMLISSPFLNTLTIPLNKSQPYLSPSCPFWQNCFSSSFLLFFFLPPTLLFVFLTRLCYGVTGPRVSGSANIGGLC